MTFIAPLIETARLRLRPRTAEDFEAQLAIDLDPAVRQFIPMLASTREEFAERFFARLTGDLAGTGFYWSVEERDTPGLIGTIFIVPYLETTDFELGYRYAPSAWGKGLGGEAAIAAARHWFEILGRKKLVGVTGDSNHGSAAVLTKAGLIETGRASYRGHDVRYFEKIAGQDCSERG
ncbi:GNAT family N-acetyltransferase [Lacibacterium aquatile]|uniref:GNAT family N-acetyltransferase n=1 Tax=Lacibacterium aquatile TaxID=1168082 RepID=A0ABW5DUJ0_9PROT